MPRGEGEFLASFHLRESATLCARAESYLLLERNRDEERKRAFAFAVSVSSAFGSSLAYFDTPVVRLRPPSLPPLAIAYAHIPVAFVRFVRPPARLRPVAVVVPAVVVNSYSER